ncbi:hypothetical protein diail_10519 [Diaporthe ilicicola]|nr:hypothetical protein diail_10519 [Diaporthe ilicicola]
MSTTLEEQINLQRVEGTDTFTASWHEDWTVGPALHGGGLAAIIQLTATTYLRTDARRFRNQPHLLNLHLDFLRPCERCSSTIVVTPLKIGAAVSTLQLQLLFQGDERIDETYVAWMTDFIPSMSDTLLQNGGLYDAHVFQQRAEQWANEHPGVTCQTTNTLAEAAKSIIFNNTLTIDIEYKRALPKEGLRFVLMRTAANALSGGRMHIEITFCDEDMELVATARQSILVLDAARKFGPKKEPSKI